MYIHNGPAHLVLLGILWRFDNKDLDLVSKISSWHSLSIIREHQANLQDQLGIPIPFGLEPEMTWPNLKFQCNPLFDLLRKTIK